MPDRTPNETFAFRDATADDVAEIAEIYNASITAGGATMDQDLKTAADMRRQMKSFSPREVILLLEQERQQDLATEGRQQSVAPEGHKQTILGWGIIKKYSDRSGYRFCCETAVYLRRELTGRGLGTRIKLALIERCRQYGYHHLVAKILAVNTASIEYNKKLGYELVGTQREIGYTDGRWQDVVILQLILDDAPTEIPSSLATND